MARPYGAYVVNNRIVDERQFFRLYHECLPGDMVEYGSFLDVVKKLVEILLSQNKECGFLGDKILDTESFVHEIKKRIVKVKTVTQEEKLGV